MMINQTQFETGDRPPSLRGGMVGQTAQDLARRAGEWDRHALDAEARLAA